MKGISATEAKDLLGCEGGDAHDLFHRAGKVRLETRGRSVKLCSVLNAKSGACSEDCAFCSQSSSARTRVDVYPLLDSRKMIGAARDAARRGAHRFGIVTSGRGVRKPEEVGTIARTIEWISRETPMQPCLSLGLVDRETLRLLKAAGATRYHHNLETARSYFKEICTTRDWEASVATVEAAKAEGLETCCGGIFGLGESIDQRVELLESIRDLEVQSVPLNFLNPIAGTRLESLKAITPLECLKVIAVSRLMMPRSEIRVCGGREVNLRDLQSWALFSGADGLMVGGYLTTGGRDVAKDLEMIADAGFEVSAGPES
ncbi:MAG: biotin synthase BioB [Planctomycetota bacterium]|jgi:biotin synthase